MKEMSEQETLDMQDRMELLSLKEASLLTGKTKKELKEMVAIGELYAMRGFPDSKYFFPKGLLFAHIRSNIDITKYIKKDKP